MQKNNWYEKDENSVIEELNSNLDKGLSKTEYEERKEKYDLNVFAQEKKVHPIVVFLKNFIEPLIIVLFAVAILSFAIKEWKEGVVIVVIVVTNALIATYQELKSQKTLDSLKKLSSPQVTVRRDGELFVIDSSELVPGDIVILDAGRFVPADIRIIEASHFYVDESALTGESVPVLKTSESIKVSHEKIGIGDQANMVFMSTFITAGRAVGIVVSTGIETEMGKISNLISSVKAQKTPLQKKLAKLTAFTSLGAFVLALVMFGIQLINSSVISALIPSITLAVAVIPESLPIIISVTLAISVQKMAKRNAIVKKLPSVETLGAVNVICSDKTGTLTQNKMSVVALISDNGITKAEDFKANGKTENILLESMVLCNDSFINTDEDLIGDPTETALVVFGRKFNLNEHDLRKSKPRIDELPFDSSRKMMTSVNEDGVNQIVYTKGAIDNVLEHCSHILLNDKAVKLTPDVKKEILTHASALSSKALRILGFAYKTNQKDQSLESNLTFIGAVGMIDPPRLEVAEAIDQAKLAAIDVVMITGDHKDTALAIAKDLGIASAMDQAITGAELDMLDEESFRKNVRQWKVFARVSPEHKVKIVQALQSHNLVVSMTGDGVNDAPSLKTADIGVAMGITGTDVSKDAADMILADDNFSTIVNAVSEGRNIYKKIKRAISFVLSTNLAEVLAVFIILLATSHSALGAVQILWINLMIESIIAIPMSLDKNTTSVMHEKPRLVKESIFKGILLQTLFSALVTAGAVIGAYFIGHSDSGSQEAQAMAFLVMACAPMLSALVIRYEKLVLFTKRMWSNKYLLSAIAIGIALNFIAIYTPVSYVMDLTSIRWEYLLICIALICAPAILIEMLKSSMRLHKKYSIKK